MRDQVVGALRFRFIVDADDVLPLGDDAGLDCRGARSVDNDPALIKAEVLDHLDQHLAFVVVPDEAHHQRDSSQGGDIIGDICRAAEADRFRIDLDDRHRGFRGDAVYCPPVISVDHQIADDSDAFPAHIVEKRLRPLSSKRNQEASCCQIL